MQAGIFGFFSSSSLSLSLSLSLPLSLHLQLLHLILRHPLPSFAFVSLRDLSLLSTGFAFSLFFSLLPVTLPTYLFCLLTPSSHPSSLRGPPLSTPPTLCSTHHCDLDLDFFPPEHACPSLISLPRRGWLHAYRSWMI
ncbi:hypothetical protein P175DRAFT_0208900 [Aspergillus ochraceoroseus IBT 24754]|uniref:Uncharacterized protein n=1 Tax=Aspergillus ochraceoroseus IBT 24754 TaxID=1392256 RepID=A0A2T5M0C2_9EURO|nr:uncharacterized protein P175DRAFT_0208900 [Aspergillus ochraceoroseus IBT 24754]PTU21973.1 hypothetical protein P175DRAFT_0208900 [Aspergillus ochraceoroseus IBT 24754]